MTSYLADHTILVYPFTQQCEGDETIIANASGSAFLSLPTSAIDILAWLAQEKTVGEAQALYTQKYGEVPDIEDFLTLLESEGFVSSQANVLLDASLSQLVTDVPTTASLLGGIKYYHFEFLSQKLARRFFAPPILFGGIFLIILALILVVLDPTVIPSPQVLVFHDHLTLLSIGLLLFSIASLFAHEMAHLLAARAAGVSVRLGISHRLWVLVAQTDISGIWMAPKHQRYLALLAGSFLDAAVAALLIVLLFAHHRGFIVLSPLLLLFCQITLLSNLFRILWECYFFVRTDFYYALALFFNCKNLMGDTETFLSNLCSRILPFIRPVDQSAIPEREMRFIRVYAWIWILGRIAALLSLFFITLPIFTGYYQEIGTFLLKGQLPRAIPLADAVGWLILTCTPIILFMAGFVLWFRSLYQKSLSFLRRKIEK